ncbi:MAG TPA: hypothetical protein VGO47_14860 [Chlamydiales bacterium]|nr:hypothetical protein [Chlamydiales bacterium]
MASNNKLLEVPEQVSKVLFPNDQLSIARFLEYPLPAVTTVVHDLSLKLEDFFDTMVPSDPVNLFQLAKQPLPSPHMVKKLIEDLPKQVLAGKQSITCAHGGMFNLKRLPFWILGYWFKVLKYHRILSEWLKADSWVWSLLSHSKNDEDRDVIKDVLEMFTLLPWSGTLCGVDWTMSIQALLMLLGTKWLSTDHMDLLLYATKRRLSSKLDVLQQYQLYELAFVNKLISAYQTEGKIPDRIHKVAAELASGKCLGIGGYVNVNGNHWVSWAVSKDWTLYYGDSQSNEVDKNVEAALTWWLQPYSRQAISLKRMDISAQLDSYSCGILSDNALEHFFASDVPLVSQAQIPVLRCKTFLDISRRHLAMVLYS